ncbi:hypothetical protein KIN20_035425 [Parelaphostrongylus tenuis]|uniref:Uncharacterized protein n=1 Tax=Parelaphostrongylus tenuis TaxID=148309 RepID=A0AAD5REF4_PARTN|nr:hypothetical protein KIN20_035425 [Parelaphostrongylus tenuis]
MNDSLLRVKSHADVMLADPVNLTDAFAPKDITLSVSRSTIGRYNKVLPFEKIHFAVIHSRKFDPTGRSTPRGRTPVDRRLECSVTVRETRISHNTWTISGVSVAWNDA